MAGCYGNSPEDRYFEKMLHDHLNRQDEADARLEAKQDDRKEKIYASLKEFEAYCIDYEGFEAMSLELLRALNSIGRANKGQQPYIDAVMQAVTRMKYALDAHIDKTVEDQDG